MKRLIFLIFTIICSMILYTCVSPLAVKGLAENGINGINYFSKSVLGEAILGVSVSSSQILIGFVDGSQTQPSSPSLDDEVVYATDGINGNGISGVYPNVNFQNGVISGTIKFIDSNQLKITFEQRIYPYMKMWDVVCEK